MGSQLLPLVVFAAEVCVVTLSTLRIIFVSRGMKFLAAILGFFEITMWLFAIGRVMQNLGDYRCFLAFAAGFSLGNFLGITIEKKLALGTLLVRIITNRDATELIAGFKSAGYGVTRVDAQGTAGPVQMIFTVIPRQELKHALAVVKGFDPRAFFSVDDVQLATAGVFPEPRSRLRGLISSFPRLTRPAA